MKPVKVRNLEIGTGIPKICVPIVGAARAEITAAARKVVEVGADIVEWRVDWYDSGNDYVSVEATLCELREILGDIPLLFTFRTDKEGGEKGIGAGEYTELNQRAAKSGYIDMVDAELFIGDEFVEEIIRTAHGHGVKVILSNHDFQATPQKEELIRRLVMMQELGADIPKIAVMPQSKKDLLTLLSATEEMAAEYAEGPIITMAMNNTGLISRFCGEVFGSAVTFGALGKASAPGQIAIKDLRRMLEIVHANL